MMEKNIFNLQNINKHKEIANELLKKGFAYKCYCSEKKLKNKK